MPGQSCSECSGFKSKVLLNEIYIEAFNVAGNIILPYVASSEDY
jgi:hypothetical protein